MDVPYIADALIPVCVHHIWCYRSRHSERNRCYRIRECDCRSVLVPCKACQCSPCLCRLPCRIEICHLDSWLRYGRKRTRFNSECQCAGCRLANPVSREVYLIAHHLERQRDFLPAEHRRTERACKRDHDAFVFRRPNPRCLVNELDGSCGRSTLELFFPGDVALALVRCPVCLDVQRDLAHRTGSCLRLESSREFEGFFRVCFYKVILYPCTNIIFLFLICALHIVCVFLFLRHFKLPLRSDRAILRIAGSMPPNFLGI